MFQRKRAGLPIFDTVIRIGAADDLISVDTPLCWEWWGTNPYSQGNDPAARILTLELGRGTATWSRIALAQSIIRPFTSYWRKPYLRPLPPSNWRLKPYLIEKISYLRPWARWSNSILAKRIGPGRYVLWDSRSQDRWFARIEAGGYDFGQSSKDKPSKYRLQTRLLKVSSRIWTNVPLWEGQKIQWSELKNLDLYNINSIDHDGSRQVKRSVKRVGGKNSDKGFVFPPQWLSHLDKRTKIPINRLQILY